MQLSPDRFNDRFVDAITKNMLTHLRKESVAQTA
jgi:hypothetical protein